MTNPDGMHRPQQRQDRRERGRGSLQKQKPANTSRNLKRWRRGLPAPLPSKHTDRCPAAEQAAHTPPEGDWLPRRFAHWIVRKSWLRNSSGRNRRRGPTRGQIEAMPGVRLEAVESNEKPSAHAIAIKKPRIFHGKLAEVDSRKEAGDLIRAQTQPEQQHRHEKLRHVKTDVGKIGRDFSRNRLDQIQMVRCSAVGRVRDHAASRNRDFEDAHHEKERNIAPHMQKLHDCHRDFAGHHCRPLEIRKIWNPGNGPNATLARKILMPENRNRGPATSGETFYPSHEYVFASSNLRFAQIVQLLH